MIFFLSSDDDDDCSPHSNGFAFLNFKLFQIIKTIAIT